MGGAVVRNAASRITEFQPIAYALSTSVKQYSSIKRTGLAILDKANNAFSIPASFASAEFLNESASIPVSNILPPFTNCCHCAQGVVSSEALANPF